MLMTQTQKVEFRVFGTPAPKGSKTAFVRHGRAVVVDGSSSSGRQKLASWAAEVAREAANERPLVPLSGPVCVEITFYMPKPKSAPKAKVWCDKKPDADKVTRATLDPMSGVIFHDDGQVSALSVRKMYATPDEPAGALVVVYPL